MGFPGLATASARLSAGYVRAVHVTRWGRSALESDDALRAERDAVAALGHDWAFVDPPRHPHGADVLIVHSGVPVDRAALAVLAPGSWVVTTTSGTDHVDLRAAEDLGVGVARCPLARRDAVTGWTLAALESLFRCWPALQIAARAGRWARADLPALAPRTLSQVTVAVVGLGVIGSQVADRLRGLGATVRGVDPRIPGTLPLADALRGADGLTLHCALEPQSRRLIDGAALDQLGPQAVVVHTARGDVLDLEAAVARLDAGALGGLAVDVYPREPFPGLAALERRGIWATPHTAGFTFDLPDRVRAELLDALRRIGAGECPTHTVVAGNQR
jgi:phosphoglycerate dehydrogenase-like enzyme